MKRIVLVLLTLIVAVTVGLYVFTMTRTTPKATQLLPDSTLVFMRAPHFAQGVEAFRKTEIYRLVQEPEMQTFLERPRQTLSELLGHDLNSPQNTVASFFILNALQGEVFLALTRVSVLPSLRPGLVFGADVKGHRIEAKLALDELTKKLDRDLPKLHPVSHRHQGVRYTVCLVRPGLTVCYGLLNTMLVATLGEEEMRDVIDRYTHHMPPEVLPLSANPSYRRVAQHFPTGGAAQTFVNVEEAVKLVGPLMLFAGQQGGGTLQSIARIQALGSSMSFTPQSIVDVSYTAYIKSDAPAPAPLARSTLAFTTPQTSLYFAQHTDMSALYQRALDGIASSDKKEMQAMANSLATFEKTCARRGVRVADDLMPALGPETAVLGMWRPGTQYPEFAFVTEIKNADQTRKAIDTALAVLKESLLGTDEQAPWETTEHLGETLHTVRIGSGTFAPTYVTTDKFFIFSRTPDYARELISQLKHPQPTLAGNAEFQKIDKQFPPHLSSFTYVDMRGITEQLLTFVGNAIPGMVDNESVQKLLDFKKLPRVETIAKHLSPYISATVETPNDQTTITYSPCGKAILYAGGATIAGYVAWEQYGYLLDNFSIPGLPKASSDKAAPLPQPENQTAVPQNPMPQ